MTILASTSNSTRLMIYAIICTLVVAFGAMGAVLTFKVAPEYSLMGLFIGSAIGAFLSVYESTIIGCITGMIFGLLVAPVVYHFIDFETAYMVIFVLSLFGAFCGEPIAYFWREANREETEESEESEEGNAEEIEDTEEADEIVNVNDDDLLESNIKETKSE